MAAVGDVVSTQNNSLLAHKITASLSLDIKRCDIPSTPPAQYSRSSTGQESGEKREPCCLKIDLPAYLSGFCRFLPSQAYLIS